MFDSRGEESSVILVQDHQGSAPTRSVKLKGRVSRANNAVANFSRNFEFGIVLAFVTAIIISSILNYLAIRISSTGSWTDLLGDRRIAPLGLDSIAFGYAFQWTTLIASSYVVFFGIYFLTDPKRAKRTSSTDAIQDRRFVSRIVEVFFFAFCVNICGNFVYQFCSSAFDVIFNRGILDIDSLGKFSFFVRGLASAFFGKKIGDGNNFQTSCIYVLLEFVLLLIILTIVLFWSRKYISEGRKVSLSLSKRDWHDRFDELVNELGLGLPDTKAGLADLGPARRGIALNWRKPPEQAVSASTDASAPVVVGRTYEAALSETELAQLVGSSDLAASIASLAEARDVRIGTSLKSYASVLAFRRLYSATKTSLDGCAERQRRAERTISAISTRMAEYEAAKAKDQEILTGFDAETRALKDKTRTDTRALLERMTGSIAQAEGTAYISNLLYQSRLKPRTHLLDWLLFWRVKKEWQETPMCARLRDALVVLARGDLKAVLAGNEASDNMLTALAKMTEVAQHLLVPPVGTSDAKAGAGHQIPAPDSETSTPPLEAFLSDVDLLKSGLDGFNQNARDLQERYDEAARRLSDNQRDQDENSQAVADCEKEKRNVEACLAALAAIFSRMILGLDLVVQKADYLSKINRHGDDLSDSVRKIVDRLWLISLSTILAGWRALKKSKSFDKYDETAATDLMTFIDTIPQDLRSAYVSGFKHELNLLTAKGGLYITQLAQGVFTVPTSNETNANRKDAIVALGAGEWVVTDALDVRGPKAILWSIVVAAAAFTVVNGCLAQPDRDSGHYVWAFQTNLSIVLLFVAFSLPILFVSTVVYLNYAKLRDEEPNQEAQDGNELEIFFGYAGIAALVLFVLFGAFVFFQQMPKSTAPGIKTSQTAPAPPPVTSPDDLVCNVGKPSPAASVNGQHMSVWTFGAADRVEVDLEKCQNVGRFTGMVYVVGIASYEGKPPQELPRADERALAIARKFPAATVRIINLGQANAASRVSGEQRPLVIIANKLGSGTADIKTMDANALSTLKANLQGQTYTGYCTISAYSGPETFDPNVGNNIDDAKFCAKIPTSPKAAPGQSNHGKR